MGNPFENPPIQPEKDLGRTDAPDGVGKKESAEAESRWVHPKGKKVSEGLADIARKFEEHSREKRKNEDGKSYTIEVRSKRKVGRTVEVIHKQKAA